MRGSSDTSGDPRGDDVDWYGTAAFLGASISCCNFHRNPAGVHVGVDVRAHIAVPAPLDEPGGVAPAEFEDAPEGFAHERGHRTFPKRAGNALREPTSPRRSQASAGCQYSLTSTHAVAVTVAISAHSEGHGQENNAEVNCAVVCYVVDTTRRNACFSSPDSDETFPGDEQEEDFSMRDDQFLVSDRTENKFYGNR